jgi:hypothetical protein
MSQILNLSEPGLAAAALTGLLLGLEGSLAVLLLGVAVLLLLIGINLTTYQRLTYEKPVAELSFQELGPQHFQARLSGVQGRPAGRYDLYGDEWQIDARILKWKPPVTLLGLDARYRLERLGGRYRDIAQEREHPRAVYRLAPRSELDLWELIGELQSHLGWVDAYYGNAAYLPMADGARYEVSLTQTGLVARPVNEAARQAVSRW